MNVMILMLLLFVLFFWVLLAEPTNLISPTLWMVSMFILACIGYIASISSFGTDISVATMIVIITSLLAGWIGELLSKHVRIKVYGKKQFANEKSLVSPNLSVIWVSGVFVLLLGLYRYYEMYLFTKTVGNKDIFRTVQYIRGYMTIGDFSFNSLITFLSGLADAIVFFSFAITISIMA